jgi:hypothetical protein
MKRFEKILLEPSPEYLTANSRMNTGLTAVKAASSLYPIDFSRSYTNTPAF